MDRLNVLARIGGKEGVDKMFPHVGRGLGATVTLELPPYTCKEHQRARLVAVEPSPYRARALVVIRFGEAGHPHKAAMFGLLEIGLPISAIGVAHVG
jgi:hypothetical protein